MLGGGHDRRPLQALVQTTPSGQLAELAPALRRPRSLAYGQARRQADAGRCSAVRRTLAGFCGQASPFLYNPRLAMYWTMPSGTRYQIGSPSATRCRHPVEEIASAGISTRLTLSSGRP